MNDLRPPRTPPAPTRLRPVGEQLREWRQRRRMSQLDLACEAAVSTRHLSFVETGRASPSRELVLRLGERLGVPLRDRNALLLAAGYAPMFKERRLDDPELAAARATVERLLRAHLPFPALAVDGHWNLVVANDAVAPLLQGAAPELTAQPVNLMRLALHPRGLAPRIVNLSEWRAHLLSRLHAQMLASGDGAIAALLAELAGYPAPAGARADTHFETAGIVVPLVLRTDAGVLAFLATHTVFGSAVDVTLSEISLETFFPADEATACALAQAARDRAT